jgi:hypothetical protein
LPLLTCNSRLTWLIDCLTENFCWSSPAQWASLDSWPYFTFWRLWEYLTVGRSGNCCWSSSTRPFLPPSPAGLIPQYWGLTTLGVVQLYLTASLTTKLLLVLASTVILDSEYHGTNDHYLTFWRLWEPSELLLFECKGQNQRHVTTDGQCLVSIGVKPHLGPKTRFLSLSDSCGFIDVGRPLWWEDGTAITIWVRVRVTLRLVVYRQSVRLGEKPVATHDQQFFLQLNTCCYRTYLISSLTRGYLLFTIAAGLRQRSHSQVRVPRDSWPDFTVPDPRLSLSVGPGPRIYIPQEQGWPNDTLRHWVPFPLPPTTPRAMVEVFEPASTRWCYFLVILFISLARTALKTPCPKLLHRCLFPRRRVCHAAA